MKNFLYKLGFIGTGNMAKAIAQGVLKSNLLTSSQMISSNTSGKSFIDGIRTVKDNSYILNNCEYVVLAVKPQIYRPICSDFTNYSCKALISVMAAISVDTIASTFPNAEVFRIMPNTPCTLGEGMSVIAENNNSEISNEFVKTIFSSIGKCEFVKEELFDAVTSVSGSGPAYVYMFIKGMIDGGIDGGLSFEQSKNLTLQTFIGACAMAKDCDDLDLLISKVCSKGGTTIEAVSSLQNDNLNAEIRNAMKACKNRSSELSKA